MLRGCGYVVDIGQGRSIHSEPPQPACLDEMTWPSGRTRRPRSSVQSRLLPVVLYVNTWVRIQIHHSFSFPIRSATHNSWEAIAVSQQCLCVPSFIRSLTLYFFYFSSSLYPEFALHMYFIGLYYVRDRSVSIVTTLGDMHSKNTSPSRSPVGCNQAPGGYCAVCEVIQWQQQDAKL
jgi:hypothetical protein